MSNKPLAEKIYGKRDKKSSSSSSSKSKSKSAASPITFKALHTPFSASESKPLSSFHVGINIDDLPAPSSGERSPGLHLSTIIRDVAITSGILKIKDVGDSISDLDISLSEIIGIAGLPEYKEHKGFTFGAVLRVICGLAFEEFFGEFCKNDWIYHFGEVELDGVAGTPDAIWSYAHWTNTDKERCDIETIEVLVELKFTWKSTNNANFWMWECQIKSYCKMLGIRRARLIILYCNGNYGPFEPQLKVFDYFFSDQELNENWFMLIRHARKHLGLKG